MIRRRCGNAPFLGEPAVDEGEELRIDHVRRLGFLCSLQPGKSRENVVAGGARRARSRKVAQRVDDAGFPVDQGAVAIEGEDVEVVRRMAALGSSADALW